MMHDWTILLLRITARAGLFLTVTTWLLGQWAPSHAGVTLGAVHVRLGTNEFANAVIWVPANQASVFGKDVHDALNYIHEVHADGSVPGILYRVRELRRRGFVRVDHWLSCLTFLIVAVAAGRRQNDDQSRATVVEAAEA